MEQKLVTILTPEGLENLVKRIVYDVVEKQDAKEWFSSEEDATYTSLSVDTLYQARLLGQNPYSKIGRSVRMRKQDLDAWMEALKVNRKIIK